MVEEIVHRAAHAARERAVLDVTARALGVRAKRSRPMWSKRSLVCCVNTLRSAVKRARPRSKSCSPAAPAPSCGRRRPDSCRAARAIPELFGNASDPCVEGVTAAASERTSPFEAAPTISRLAGMSSGTATSRRQAASGSSASSPFTLATRALGCAAKPATPDSTASAHCCASGADLGVDLLSLLRSSTGRRSCSG